MTGGWSYRLTSSLRFADRAIRWLNGAGAALAAVFLVIVVVVGVCDVIGTTLLRTPLPSALEISQNGMVFIAFGGLACALQRGSHVAVDIFVGKLRPSARRMATGLALIVTCMVFGFVGWRAGTGAIESFRIDEWSSGLFQFPVYPARAALSFGCVIAALESVRQFVRLLIGRSEAGGPASVKDQVL
jgi:TRAP-type C4-dicarboxylate transport system permease small subunit